MTDKHARTDARPADGPRERRQESGATESTVVPFPGPRKKPQAPRPERVLLDLDDFDPGPGAA